MLKIQTFFKIINNNMLDLYKYLAQTKLKDFVLKYKKEFNRAPAAQDYHHNFTGGLLLHTNEVLEIMIRLARFLPYNNLNYPKPDFTREEMIVSAYLHDFAKIATYVEDAPDAWRWEDIELPAEVWTLNELAKAGIGLTVNELNALLYAEGGWSAFKEFVQDMKPLAILLHMADLWSAKVLYFTEEIKCPICGAPMKKRQTRDKTNIFYGCSRYPNCLGTKEVGEVEKERKELQERMKNYKHIYLKRKAKSERQKAKN